MRRIVAAAAIVSGLACAATAVLAVDLPARKPGLWEVTLNMPGGKMPPRLMKFCTDAETDAALFKLGMNAAQGICSRNDVQRSGNVVTMDSECKLGDTKMTSRAVMTFTGDAAYHTDIQSHFDPPMMGRSEFVDDAGSEVGRGVSRRHEAGRYDRAQRDEDEFEIGRAVTRDAAGVFGWTT